MYIKPQEVAVIKQDALLDSFVVITDVGVEVLFRYRRLVPPYLLSYCEKHEPTHIDDDFSHMSWVLKEG